MGPHKEYGVSPGRLPGQGCEAFNRETASPGEGWAVVLPVPGGGNEGGGDRADSDVDPSEAEHGRAIIATRPILGLCEVAVRRPGAQVPRIWWEQTGINWKAAMEKAAEKEEDKAVEAKNRS